MTNTAKRSALPTGLVLLALGILGVVLVYGCGTVTNDRADAIKQATDATCSRYQQCGLIGPGAGASYATADECQAHWNDTFTKQWTVAQCQGHIDHPMLSVCLNAINGTSCTSVLDVLNTLYVKCGAGPVCDVPPDAGAHD